MAKKNEPVLVNGRECEVIKLSNGDQLYFPLEYTGGELFDANEIMFSGIEMKPGMKREDFSMDLGMNLKNTILTFVVFCKQIVDKSGKQIPVTNEYPRNLNTADASIISNKLQDCASAVNTVVKKRNLKG